MVWTELTEKQWKKTVSIISRDLCVCVLLLLSCTGARCRPNKIDAKLKTLVARRVANFSLLFVESEPGPNKATSRINEKYQLRCSEPSSETHEKEEEEEI